QLDRADFGAILVTLAALLRLFVVVQFAFDATVGAMEEIDGRPQQVFGVGFVLQGAVAVKLEFGEDVIGRGCGVRRLVACVVVFDRHGGLPWSDWSRSSRPSWRRKAAGGPDL